MKKQESIPTSKVARATKFIQTGVKVGGNYLKHYAKKLVNPELSKEELHESNAQDIYKTLSELKGSALKVAQMMSMDKNVLPKAYVDRFTMAQYSAPPLSYPLVVKTFKKYLGKSPTEIFDTFSKDAVNAASIGQVHQATLNGKKLAVKVQYPGVAESIKSDLRMVKPFAIRILNMNEKDIDLYMQEVESKLLEEADYDLELKRSVEISQACSHFPDLFFAKYYPEYSCKKILTMDWLEGKHLPEFLKTNPSQEVRNRIGQALWDFYDYQIHTLRAVHADPHPGNFLLTPEGKVGVIDFGCVKEIPQEYYDNYFIVINPYLLKDEATLLQTFKNLGFILPEDSPEQQALFTRLFKGMIELLGKPFHSETFDFGNDAYFQEIYEYAESLARTEELRKTNQARGSRHGLYINRTYFGLYSILNQLKANIRTTKPEFLRKPIG
ncbi:MAG: AarF/UbiB family protein [Raineya sp.]|nr:AarF/UbiB family protein [Raineya sp.]MDW8297488.1 AarF/UbiB family protein [Raineya sp.]